MFIVTEYAALKGKVKQHRIERCTLIGEGIASEALIYKNDAHLTNAACIKFVFVDALRAS